MATLSSTSTLAEVLAAYDDNASYEEDGSAAKAKAFVTACRLLLMKIPKRSEWQGVAVTEYDPEQIRQAMEAARVYALANAAPADGGGSYDVIHVEFGDFRT